MNKVNVEVKAQYIDEQSDSSAARHVYAYTVRIHNQGDTPAKLVSRHWVITDAQEEVQEVKGLGVVGEQPTLAPGESYSYTSGAVLKTETGLMQGTYTMQDAHGQEFAAEIPPFALVRPSALH